MKTVNGHGEGVAKGKGSPELYYRVDSCIKVLYAEGTHCSLRDLQRVLR